MIKGDSYIRHIFKYIDSLSESASAAKLKAYKTDLKEFAIFVNLRATATSSNDKLDSELGQESPTLSGAATTPVLEINKEIISEYVQYLMSENRSYATINRRLSSLRSYFKYLRKNLGAQTPDVELPDFCPKRKNNESENPAEILNEKQIERLLAGIIRNDAYLPSGSESPIAILPEVKVRRDPTIYRNKAIILLFLESGISIQELCSLDIQDVNTDRNFAIIRGQNERTVYFGANASSAISEYISSVPLPKVLVDRYMFAYPKEFEWCRANAKKRTIETDIEAEFSSQAGYNSFFRQDMHALAAAMRRQGRTNIANVGSFPALFISSKGNRISPRTVEHIVSEMIHTYLPEFSGEASVETLRKTFAANLAKKSKGNISAVLYQMGQKHLPKCAASIVPKRDSVKEIIEKSFS